MPLEQGPGVDGQDLSDIESYGVQRWLGELALALRERLYQSDPIRRVFTPKANGKLRPLGISTLRDRVCMTAVMLVLEPIFEADLPPEQYAYRPGRNARRRWSRWRSGCFMVAKRWLMPTSRTTLGAFPTPD